LFSQTTVQDPETQKEFSAVNCYFMQQDGQTFKAQVRYAPYFLLATKPDCEHDVEAFLRRRHEGKIHDVVMVDKEDLDLKNHLSGLKQRYLKVIFATVQDLMDVRREVLPMVKKNQQKNEAAEAYEALHAMELGNDGGAGRAHHRETERGGVNGGAHDGRVKSKGKSGVGNYADAIVDIREYDVPYHMRWLIDTDARCGWWYDVRASAGEVSLRHRDDLLTRGEVRVCAFDIETTKLPLKFPDAEFDQVFMISYMLDGQGYLIINREVVGADVDDFEYSPKPEYPGPFIVWNEPDETALLRRWFDHMRETQPCVYVTYNGDFFDWPFVETRAEKCGMSLYDELGFRCDRKTGECRSRSALHLDAFAWVKRDSYLARGIARSESRDQGEAQVQPGGSGPRGHAPIRADAAADDGGVLGVRRGVHVLPVHEVRAPVHLLAGHDHPHVPRRGSQKGLGDALRGAADGAGVPGEHRVPEQNAVGGREALQGPFAGERDVHRRARRVPRSRRVPRGHPH
jgi:DNA polymerase epsilon subunit 1